MIRWCAYCQRYQGEVEPFDDYEITHGICQACSERQAFATDEPSNLAAIREFFSRIGRSAASMSAFEVVREGAALGLDPVDLLLGIVQPLLREIGQRWARGKATIAEEHRISALCSAVVQLLVETDARVARQRQARRPTVLLVSVEGNYHTLGLQIVEVCLLRNHVPTFTVYPGLPEAEIVTLARSLRPRIVALSAAMREQVQTAMKVGAQLAVLPPRERPLVVLGGLALRDQGVPSVDGSVVVYHDLSAFIDLARASTSPARARESELARGC